MVTKSGQKWRVGVIGDPVAHSISPGMQQPALDHLGIDATYERWHTPATELEARIASLRLQDVLGANVTVPHKLAVTPFLDEVSDLARRAGAVNTIVNRDGRLHGDNTDIHGFAASLIAVDPNLVNRTALILGAGGAARAVALALESAGVRHIALHNRHPDRAERLAADLRPLKLHLIADDAFREVLAETTILVNATSLGWHPGETPIDLQFLEQLPLDALVVDLTYRDTDLLLSARDRGLNALDGLPMLVHQGARALELWTGQPAPVEIMMAAAEKERASRA